MWIFQICLNHKSVCLRNGIEHCISLYRELFEMIQIISEYIYIIIHILSINCIYEVFTYFVFIYLFIHLFIHVLIYLFIYLTSLFIHPSVHLCAYFID